MLAIIVRDIPQQERESFVSSLGLTETFPFSSLARTYSTSAIRVSPFGPLTETFCPLRFTVTPAGTGTGFFPILDITRSSKHRANHFAANVLGACLRIRH